MPDTYAEYLARLVPPSFQGDGGWALMIALGQVMDDLRDEATQASRSGMPGLAASGTVDALPIIGDDRQLERAPLETDAAYGERLRTAPDSWERAGSHRALLEQLIPFGYDRTTMFTVQRSGRRCSVDVSGNLVVVDGAIWTFDGKPPEAYAQFGLFFTTPQPGLTWSTGGGFSQEAVRLNRLAWLWRPPKAEFMGTYIVNSGATWGWPASRTWGSFNWGGSATFIPPR